MPHFPPSESRRFRNPPVGVSCLSPPFPASCKADEDLLGLFRVVLKLHSEAERNDEDPGCPQITQRRQRGAQDQLQDQQQAAAQNHAEGQ